MGRRNRSEERGVSEIMKDGKKCEGGDKKQQNALIEDEEGFRKERKYKKYEDKRMIIKGRRVFTRGGKTADDVR